MQSNFFTEILLPLALAIVMLGMGLSLVPKDFQRITRDPVAVAVGTMCQVLLLPLIGVLITLIVPMQSAIASLVRCVNARETRPYHSIRFR